MASALTDDYQFIIAGNFVQVRTAFFGANEAQVVVVVPRHCSADVVETAIGRVVPDGYETVDREWEEVNDPTFPYHATPKQLKEAKACITHLKE
jgi:hypothetical protein